jgi:hypothetical protein
MGRIREADGFRIKGSIVPQYTSSRTGRQLLSPRFLQSPVSDGRPGKGIGTHEFGCLTVIHYCAVFDEWVRQDIGRIIVQIFEDRDQKMG